QRLAEAGWLNAAMLVLVFVLAAQTLASAADYFSGKGPAGQGVSLGYFLFLVCTSPLVAVLWVLLLAEAMAAVSYLLDALTMIAGNMLAVALVCIGLAEVRPRPRRPTGAFRRCLRTCLTPLEAPCDTGDRDDHLVSVLAGEVGLPLPGRFQHYCRSEQ